MKNIVTALENAFEVCRLTWPHFHHFMCAGGSQHEQLPTVEGALKLKKSLVSTRWLLLILLMAFWTFSVIAQERLEVIKVKDDFNYQQPLSEWEKNTAIHHLYSSEGGVALRLYTGFDHNFLYLGFYVTDPFLTFKDDFSLDFQGSDHLRIYFFTSGNAQLKEPVTLYLLPNSKIKEPLFNILGASWRRQAIIVRSVLEIRDYFMAVAISLAELDLSPRGGQKLGLQILINDITSKGETKKHWIFGEKVNDYETLVFSH